MMTTLAILTLILPLAGAAPVNMTGKWIIDGDVQGNQVSLACVVEQNGDAKLSGKCQINGTETAEIEGSAMEATFKFAFTVQGYTLTYSGTLDNDAVSGDIEVAGVTGKFSGKRN